MQIEENVALAPLTTFQIGGPACYLISAQSIEDIKAGLKFAAKNSLSVFILGGGSNLLVDDKGFGGLVIKIELAGVSIEEGEVADTKILIAAAGEGWDKLVAKACDENLWGIENLSGIPGTVGGAVVQNIGAYGAALSETLLWVEVLDSKTNEIKKLSNVECAFGYRNSIFKHQPSLIVLRAAFALSTAPQPNTSYKDLSKLFADSSIDIQAVRDAVLAIRKGKFPDLTVEGTAGSFFKNPIVSDSQARLLVEKYPGLPLFDMPETEGVKVPLAWFLDYRHGVFDMRGIQVGDARLFESQPLVIAATFGTRAYDVRALAQKVKQEVQEKLQITIEEEVKIL